jgi:aryl-alcohol dehydrogenase-like predicted oxidoreductase
VKTRMLGNEGLVVSELGLGCMGMSEYYGRRDDSPQGASAGERYADMSSVGL